MIKEAYVSFETAKLLKEKGFDWNCTSHFDSNHIECPNTPMNFNSTKYWVSRPTHQMACAWLREVHDIFIKVGFGADDKGEFLYMADIYDLTNDAIDGRYIPIVEADEYLTDNPKTYGEAIEAACLWALKNLI